MLSLLTLSAALSMLVVTSTTQPGQAEAAFAAGRFAEAALVGRTAPTVSGRIAGGRAASTLAVYSTPDRVEAKQMLERAEADFAEALKLSPGNQEAVLQQAITIGYRAKLANSPGLAKEARKGIESAIAKNPRDPLALAALGGWHGESVATLGSFVAGTALGAKKAESIRHFDKAMALNPQGPAVPTFYAFTLLALDADNATQAKALLTRADKTKPADGFEALLQRNARDVLALLAKGDTAGARTLAKRRSPLGGLK